VPDVTAVSAAPVRRPSRRAVLALGLATAGALLVGSPARAAGVEVVVGELAFDVPADLLPQPAGPTTGGPTWAWRGARDPAAGAFLVLARADLDSADAEEVVGWLLAAGLAGALPGLTLQAGRTRSTPGGGEQVRLAVAYGAAAGARRSGTLLVATRSAGPAGVLLVLGDGRLTAGEQAAVLDSLRWVS
jgi:hypothetical protein